MKMDVKRIGAALKFDFQMSEDQLRQIGKIAEASVIDNVMSQKTVTGERIQRNTPETRELKRKLGIKQMSLIFKDHSFVRGQEQTFRIIVDKTRQSVRIEPKAEFKPIVEGLQRRGYVGWFGMNPKAMAAVRALISKWIKEYFKKVSR